MKLTQYMSVNERANGGWTHKIVLTHEDLTETTANTSQTIPIFTAPAHTCIRKACMHMPIPFKDASDPAFNSTTIIVGDSDDDAVLTSTQINENGSEVLDKPNPSTLPKAFSTDTVINAIFGSMASKSLSDIDVGELWILLEVEYLQTVK